MTITKDGKEYAVRKYKTVWTLVRKVGRVTIRYSVKKALCPDFERLKTYVANSDLF